MYQTGWTNKCKCYVCGIQSTKRMSDKHRDKIKNISPETKRICENIQCRLKSVVNECRKQRKMQTHK